MYIYIYIYICIYVYIYIYILIFLGLLAYLCLFDLDILVKVTMSGKHASKEKSDLLQF